MISNLPWGGACIGKARATRSLECVRRRPSFHQLLVRLQSAAESVACSSQEGCVLALVVGAKSALP
jgi:hypothetical protein